jgi:hypothetical protein
MRDLIRKILHEDNRDRLSGIIKKYIESTISPEYQDEICNIEVTDSEGFYRKIYRITITFDVVPSSNQINIMTDVFLMVHRFFDITPEMESRFEKGCQSNQTEVTEYSRTLKNARQQGVGLRFPKSAIKSNPSRFRHYTRQNTNEVKETIKRILQEYILLESDPKVGTGKKPKGSDRRLYTDENPSDTVSVKFKTKEDIVDTLNKESFKSKPHKRQSQIINLIHQRVRAAYQNAKDPETKKRLKRGLDYIENEKEKSKEKTVNMQKQEQTEGELNEKCWKGYTQKGMKTMFGKRYPNCVKKTK